MAVLNRNEQIEYYSSNIIKGLINWNYLTDATITNDVINISSGGIAGVDLSNSYYNGLTASKYMLVTVEIDCSINSNYNYQNYVEVVMRGNYIDSNKQTHNVFKQIALTKDDSIINGSHITMSRLIEMDNVNYNSLVFYVINHSQNTITLNSAEALRSQDISNGQITSAIGLSIMLDYVNSYLDGFEVGFVGSDEPLKLWWHENSQGKFDGININNERLVAYQSFDEVLLD
jgi:hypothetical protein